MMMTKHIWTMNNSGTTHDTRATIVFWYRWGLYEQMFQLHPMGQSLAESSLSSEFRELILRPHPFPTVLLGQTSGAQTPFR